jgi:hypothetical protein
MLEDTRKRGATIAIYVIFGILIAVFVINFGPQSVGGGQGCKAGTQGQLQVTIGEQTYGMNTWRWTLNTRPQGPYEQRARWALDALIRRELLAQEAERRGLAIPESTIDDRIKKGELLIMGEELDGKQVYLEDGEFFNYKMLMSNLVQRFGLTISSFKAELRRELLAAAMEQILASGGHASRDEVFALWVHSERTVTFDAVRFTADDYQAKMVLTDADVARYLAAHEADVKAKYEADKGTQYTATVPKVKVRRVFVKRQPPPDDEPGTGTGTGTGTGAPPKVELKPDPGQAKLEAARKDIVAKKKTMADVARALDSDDVVRAKGGDLGWKLPDAHDLGDALLTEALGKLTPGGEPSPVIETPAGFYLLAVEAKREGDLAYDAVKHEIAAALAADVYADEAAKRAALAALADARSSGKKLSEIYEQAPPKMPELSPEMRRQQLEQQLQLLKEDLKDPNKSEEEKEQIRQIIELIESGQLGMGPFEIESGDIPAEWGQAGDAAPTPTPAPAAAPPPAQAPLAPSGDVLPKIVGMDKPQVERIGPMPRDRERVVDVGRSAELVTALFETLQPGDLADTVFAVKGEETTATGQALGAGDTIYVIVQLVERPDVDVSKFEAQADDLVAREEEDRGRELVSSWLFARCNELVTKQEIKIDNDILTTRDEKGEARTFQYGACGNL